MAIQYGLLKYGPYLTKAAFITFRHLPPDAPVIAKYAGWLRETDNLLEGRI